MPLKTTSAAGGNCGTSPSRGMLHASTDHILQLLLLLWVFLSDDTVNIAHTFDNVMKSLDSEVIFVRNWATVLCIKQALLNSVQQ